MIKSHWQFIIRTALVSTLFFSTLIDGRTLTALAQIDTLIVAVAANSPPFAWKNEQGELTGFDIDLMNLVAERAGIQVTYRTEQLRYLLPAVATHFYDMGIGCLLLTPTRQAWVNFSEPYFATGIILVVRDHESTITQLSDLSAEMTVGVSQGSVGENIARNQTPAVVIPFTTPQEALAQLETGNVNTVLTDESNFFGYQPAQPENKLKTTGEILTYNECGFAVPHDKPELLAKLNIALTQLQSADDGSYATLYKKWFGQRPLPEKPAEIVKSVETVTEPPPTAVIPSYKTDNSATTTTGAASIPLTHTTDLVGIYYLKVATSGASETDSTAIRASRYQIITLADNGLWFLNEMGATTGTPTTNNQPATIHSQSGLWMVNAQKQVEATLVVFEAPYENGSSAQQINVVRRVYQMEIQSDDSVSGHYTLSTYTTDDFAQSITETPLITQTVEFMGKRVR